MKRLRLSTAISAAASLMVLAAPSSSASTPPACRIVTDPADDASLISRNPVVTPSDGALDVVSADIAAGPRNITAVVRVTHLGTAVEAGPRLDQWMVWFTFRGQGFAAVALRGIDGSQFSLYGDFPEQSHLPAPGSMERQRVTGSLDSATNEIRIVFPRDLLRRTRGGDQISNITVDSLTGAGSVATQSTASGVGVTVDRTWQPGPTTSIGEQSCVRST
jgi:hypothetical protein